MAVSHPTATRNSIVDHVVDKLDLGSGNAAGRLYFLTGADADVVYIVCDNPAFGAASSGSAAMAGVPKTSTAAAGNATVAKGQFRDRDSTAIVNCAVSTSGSDINLSGVSLGAGDTITINSLSYSVA